MVEPLALGVSRYMQHFVKTSVKPSDSVLLDIQHFLFVYVSCRGVARNFCQGLQVKGGCTINLSTNIKNLGCKIQHIVPITSVFYLS